MVQSNFVPNGRFDGLRRPHKRTAAASLPAVPAGSAVSGPAVSHSISGVAATVPAVTPFHYERRQVRRRLPFRHSWLKRLVLVLLLLLLGTGLFLGVKAFLAERHIITRNSGGGAPALAGSIDPSKLKGEGDGRINILLMGKGGAGHDGPDLTDTMMVASIDPKTKDVAMLSLPRDLWVNLPGYGFAKINSANAYGEMNRYPGGGPALAKATVSQMLDIPIHYYALIDFAGFRTAVDAVGGIDINVPKAISDPLYPCDNENHRYCPFFITAGPHHLDGTLALRYSRSRETTSDFDRAARQQQILIALRQKALSLSTLTNPIKISGLIDAVGDHVRTDLQLWEIQKLAGLLKDVDPAKVISKVLDTDGPDSLLVSHSGDNRGYIELPRGGSWEAVREFVHSIFVDNYLKTENATVEVQNGTLRSGLATSVGQLLKSYNYNVVSMVTAADQHHATTIIYDYSGGKKPYTVKYLEQRFGVKVQKATPAVSDPNIRIILGNDYHGAVSANQ